MLLNEAIRDYYPSTHFGAVSGSGQTMTDCAANASSSIIVPEDERISRLGVQSSMPKSNWEAVEWEGEVPGEGLEGVWAGVVVSLVAGAVVEGRGWILDVEAFVFESVSPRGHTSVSCAWNVCSKGDHDWLNPPPILRISLIMNVRYRSVLTGVDGKAVR
jgi:hypothetical protein